jgi:hypothetical protein
MRIAHLFRVLLPSWRFFDRAAALPRMEVRYGEDENELGPWSNPFPVQPHRAWGRIFLNARENEKFAAYGVISQFIEDPDNPVSKALIERLAEQCLRRMGSPAEKLLQFRILLEDEVIHLSPIVQVDT